MLFLINGFEALLLIKIFIECKPLYYRELPYLQTNLCFQDAALEYIFLSIFFSQVDGQLNISLSVATLLASSKVVNDWPEEITKGGPLLETTQR